MEHTWVYMYSCIIEIRMGKWQTEDKGICLSSRIQEGRKGAKEGGKKMKRKRRERGKREGWCIPVLLI